MALNIGIKDLNSMLGKETFMEMFVILDQSKPRFQQLIICLHIYHVIFVKLQEMKKKSHLITKPEKHTYIYHSFIDVLLLLKQTKGSKDNLENIRMNWSNALKRSLQLSCQLGFKNLSMFLAISLHLMLHIDL